MRVRVEIHAEGFVSSADVHLTQVSNEDLGQVVRLLAANCYEGRRQALPAEYWSSPDAIHP